MSTRIGSDSGREIGSDFLFPLDRFLHPIIGPFPYGQNGGKIVQIVSNDWSLSITWYFHHAGLYSGIEQLSNKKLLLHPRRVWRNMAGLTLSQKCEAKYDALWLFWPKYCESKLASYTFVTCDHSSCYFQQSKIPENRIRCPIKSLLERYFFVSDTISRRWKRLHFLPYKLIASEDRIRSRHRISDEKIGLVDMRL